MVIEVAHRRELQKLWGVSDPRPWSDASHARGTVGEICYDRCSDTASQPALLLKILLTSQPLSIQVHPDDVMARSLGLPNGKTEAWYVLDAQPGAVVALGLKQSLPPEQLRTAIGDGSIARLVAWHPVSVGDTVFVPAGTIHAIGPGLVIAEIQQRSNTTFRLFDHGRSRELHVDHALAAAHAAPANDQAEPQCLDNGRTLLASNPHFVFERLELEPDSKWHFDASRETWVLVLSGCVRAGDVEVARGEVVFAETERIDFRSGKNGVVCLVAYTGLGGPILKLVQHAGEQKTTMSRSRTDTARPLSMIGPHR